MGSSSSTIEEEPDDLFFFFSLSLSYFTLSIPQQEGPALDVEAGPCALVVWRGG